MTSVTADRRQGVNSGAAIKVPCKAATTANITLSGLQTIDGVALAANDRVLVKNQTTGSENGIYVADTSTWQRAPDWDGTYDIVKGTLVRITDGTLYSDSYWSVSTSNPITIDTTSVSFTQVNNALTGVSAFVETLLDDASGSAFMSTIKANLSAETAPAIADTLILGDTSAGTEDSITLENLLKVTDGLTEDSAPDVISDFLLEYDTSASAAKKVRPQMLALAAANIVMINGTLTASVGSSALTIAIKTRAGTDPSATDPVYVLFRNATAGTGDYTIRTISAANSLVVSSGSTLGTTSAEAHRLWVVLFDDSGTVRIGVINCSTTTSVYRLADDILSSSTAEGGAGAADSAGVFYTGTAVTSKALRVVGYIESTQATAGTWATTPSKIQLWTPGMKLPCDVVQIQFNQTSSYGDGTTTIPLDDTIPQNTEGVEFMSQSITPVSSINFLHIEHFGMYASSAVVMIVIALFQDSTANALAASAEEAAQTGDNVQLKMDFIMRAGTTSSTTFKIRVGGSSAATVGFNGQGGSRKFGGKAQSIMRVTEIMV